MCLSQFFALLLEVGPHLGLLCAMQHFERLEEVPAMTERNGDKMSSPDFTENVLGAGV